MSPGAGSHFARCGRADLVRRHVPLVELEDWREQLPAAAGMTCSVRSGRRFHGRSSETWRRAMRRTGSATRSGSGTSGVRFCRSSHGPKSRRSPTSWTRATGRFPSSPWGAACDRRNCSDWNAATSTEPTLFSMFGAADVEKFRHREWTPALRAAGIAHRRLYDCRHTFATWAIEGGIELWYLARVMGTSVVQIKDTYARWLTRTDDQLRAAFDAYDACPAQIAAGTP
jgi:hypothetical protein